MRLLREALEQSGRIKELSMKLWVGTLERRWVRKGLWRERRSLLVWTLMPSLERRVTSEEVLEAACVADVRRAIWKSGLVLKM